MIAFLDKLPNGNLGRFSSDATREAAQFKLDTNLPLQFLGEYRIDLYGLFTNYVTLGLARLG